MRAVLRSTVILAGLLALGCEETTVVVPVLAPPQNLSYELEPSGDPDLPAGILLAWDAVQDPALASYRVYSRGSASGSYGLRGETSSNSFHDNGVPHLQ